MGLRLAIFLPNLQGGGAERTMVMLANGLAAHGHAVDLVLAKVEGRFLSELSPQIGLVDLQASRVAFCLPGLVEYLRRSRPDIFISALDHANIIALIAWIFSWRAAGMLISEHNLVGGYYHGSTGCSGRILCWLMRRFYPKSDAIVAVSDGVADSLVSKLGVDRRKVVTVYNPVDLVAIDRLSLLPSPVVLSSAQGVHHIVSAGRLTWPKDFVTLIKAFSILRSSREAKLYILGDGPQRDMLRTEASRLGIANDVHMLGFQENPFCIIRQADLFVLSSTSEGFSNVLIEAMACGTPVVSTDCPSGPAEILEHGRWGRLVPVGDEEALAEAMIATLEEERHPDVHVRATHFSIERTVQGYISAVSPYIKPSMTR